MEQIENIRYAELQITSNFSFLRGASHPEELAERACELGLAAFSITDRNSFAGIVRGHVKAKELGIRFIPGLRLDLLDAPSLLVWPASKAAYARLADLLTTGKRRAEKGKCYLTLDDVIMASDDQIMALLEPDLPAADRLEKILGDRFYLAFQHFYQGDDGLRLKAYQALGLPLLATGDVHYHLPARRALQDVITCIRELYRIDEAGTLLYPNAERHLKSSLEMAELFKECPEALANTQKISGRCRFSLDELAYDYPVQEDYHGRSPQGELTRRTWIGARKRYGKNLPEKVRQTLKHELSLIGSLDYAPYFLTVHDIVRFAQKERILYQGRGSAANSAVCYVLGITAVDPARIDLLFERFVSAERNEPPDIDVDFEHERREEVIQHIYKAYGRDHAALAATVVRYRAKSAMREVGKVMGLSLDSIDALSRTVWGYGREGIQEDYLKSAGLDPNDPVIARTIALAQELIDTPRHLSQHVGGFVIAKSPLRHLVPIENAAMADRTVVEWDKDDLDALGMLKIDILALGMLSCIRRAFDLLRMHHGIELDLTSVPPEDPLVYEMLSNADSVGVFQVESRAQMSMLPRLKPRCFYDLVIEVAIVRPGPIQGDMVHPYLRRREGEEPVSFPSRDLEEVLGKTMGVPLFQEQAMRIAIVAAGFTPAEADGLRRSMAAFRRQGQIERYHTMLVEGMAARGYEAEFAERCFKQIEGFGYYGFPESHAASFALLVYVSAWLKYHYPGVFCAAILNSQPMGFYAPAQLVRDARDHGVSVLPADVNHSDWDATLEGRGQTDELAVRLGLRSIKGLAEEEARRIEAHRGKGYPDLPSLKRRSGIRRQTLECLADADALQSLGLDRRPGLWQVHDMKDSEPPLFRYADEIRQPHSNLPAIDHDQDPWADLPPMSIGEHVIEDYASLRLSLRAHPMALLRSEPGFRKLKTAKDLQMVRPGDTLSLAGIVLIRQRPGSAKGVVFMTLEDETGFANCVVWPDMFKRYRPLIMTARLMQVTGYLQREGKVIHVIVRKLEDRTAAFGRLRSQITDPQILDGVLSRADEFKSEPRDPAVRDQRVLPQGRNFR